MKTNIEPNASIENAAAGNNQPYEMNEDELAEVSGGFEGACFPYQIKRGDCLSVIAQRYGTSVRILCELNNIYNPNIVFPGDWILIPYRA